MHPLAERLVRGDTRALARALTILENDLEGKRGLLKSLYPYAGRAHVVGFTGAPGAGKSTLVDRVIGHLRERGLTVGVLAVDPSSPFSGGALLGDRVRMLRHSGDSGVYIRSMGSRGSLGGLAKSTGEMLYALEAYGCDVVLLETVGVGQAELDVMSVADTVVLVLTPGAGDQVQTAKAGIMEIADVFVVNKSDLPGADLIVREIWMMLRDRRQFREDWRPPVVKASAARGEGLADIWDAVTAHRDHLLRNGHWEARRRRRHERETLRLLEAAVCAQLARRAERDPAWRAVLSDHRGLDPYQAAERLLAGLPRLDDVTPE
ncbi:methylmalonyl Co-A mutase-associated GTPase MeaB [Alicyclobacillus sp.]|uniref:methylmalonyl Co-A mutase-associated GTPase MeaB n=1 Tax=Alicyclobacillus sp. TaxID=61169 RepID=UPI0025B8CF05|nr:methylmalonyl Co-A mutase-associated GTPase MeaB [Alicyclobacillus sp.]MCL6515867.1 methylmalonyl Co-A mutase-associated GTPase MeaB [Alicyclobacillus sp.]